MGTFEEELQLRFQSPEFAAKRAAMHARLEAWRQESKRWTAKTGQVNKV